jgi:hypothetical protein
MLNILKNQMFSKPKNALLPAGLRLLHRGGKTRNCSN